VKVVPFFGIFLFGLERARRSRLVFPLPVPLLYSDGFENCSPVLSTVQTYPWSQILVEGK